MSICVPCTALRKALVGLSDETEIDEVARGVIVDGLAACERLQSRLDSASIQRAAGEIMKASEGC